MAPTQNGLQQYIKLEERLVLLAWLNDLFGYKSNRDLLTDMKEAAKGSTPRAAQNAACTGVPTGRESAAARSAPEPGAGDRREKQTEARNA